MVVAASPHEANASCVPGSNAASTPSPIGTVASTLPLALSIITIAGCRSQGTAGDLWCQWPGPMRFSPAQSASGSRPDGFWCQSQRLRFCLRDCQRPGRLRDRPRKFRFAAKRDCGDHFPRFGSNHRRRLAAPVERKNLFCPGSKRIASGLRAGVHFRNRLQRFQINDADLIFLPLLGSRV